MGSPLLQNSLLGSSGPVFSHMHISLLVSLSTPLEGLCPFALATGHHDTLVFWKISQNVVATPTHVMQLMQCWKEAKEATIEAKQATKLKIPGTLQDLIYHLEIPGADSCTKVDDTIFALQLAPWQGVHTLICCYV